MTADPNHASEHLDSEKRQLVAEGDELLSKTHYEAAVAKYREAIGVDPDDPNTYNSLGIVLGAQEHFDEAIKQYGEAYERRRKKKSKDRKFALRNWADALLSKKDYDKATKMYRRARRIDPKDPNTYVRLGNLRADQELFDQAITEYSKADELWQPNGSKDRKYALWGWGWALLQKEHFEESTGKFALAAKIDPTDPQLLLNYGNSLAAFGSYRDAIAQYDKASLLDSANPYPHHNKGNFLFQLGRYEEGWREWQVAKLRYETQLKGEPWSAEQLQMAVYFADVLREIFKDYEASEGFYRRVLKQREDLKQQGDNLSACAGLAILYQQWANSDAAPPEVLAQAQLNYQVPRAITLLESQLEKGSNFWTLLSLVDLHIETSNWTEARDHLAHADLVYGGFRLKRAEVTARLGLVCFRSEEHTEAVKNFRQALLVKPRDLTLQSNLGNALFQLKKFEAAQDEFDRVLKVAPGNIDALRGAAQVSIELAEDGDPDQYGIAVQYLTDALMYGRNKDLGYGRNLKSGSKCLSKSEIAKIYYMRGYARTKSYEAGASRIMPPALPSALSDFLKCKNLDPNNRKAPAAIEKITKRLRRGVSESWVDVFGPVIIFFAGAIVFLFAQLDFFFRGTAIRTWFWLPALCSVTEPTVYIVLTFGALLFMVAGLYLPKVLKLKVGGIELEKASVDQVSAPSTLGISRSGSLTS